MRETVAHVLRVQSPYRLDLTVKVLRRLPSNPVDVLTADGTYLRLLGDPAAPTVARVRQPNPETLTIELTGNQRQHQRLLALLSGMLGVNVDLTPFYRSAECLPWLLPLVRRMQGVKPPRYPTLWEACVNAVVFQQLSLVAASSVTRRLVMTLGEPVRCDEAVLYPFPGVAEFLRVPDAELRGTGLSAGKLVTLRRAAEAIAGGLDEASLMAHPSAAAAALLRRIKGIGPWTATVILLRGLGRLDVFPGGDTSVARNLALVGGSAPLDLPAALEVLGPVQGMLYYHLLLARLEACGDVLPPTPPVS
ncbi:MAG TPA: hypothetical protein VJU15_01105 [Gemmatimonadales bacterium]|nr:hypothetical protein [Gemmatimonadales bacterium]